jgi:hypothetical protein
MPTVHTAVTISKDESRSKPFQLGPVGRIVGLSVTGDWPEKHTLGVDICVDGKDEWYSVRDGTTGERIRIKGVQGNAFYIVDFNLNDDMVRIVSLSEDGEDEVTHDEERTLKVCIAPYK